MASLSDVRLTLMVGPYAQAPVLEPRMSDGVRGKYMPSLVPLPRHSWSSQIWINQNPWADCELLPRLRSVVAGVPSEEPA